MASDLSERPKPVRLYVPRARPLRLRPLVRWLRRLSLRTGLLLAAAVGLGWLLGTLRFSWVLAASMPLRLPDHEDAPLFALSPDGEQILLGEPDPVIRDTQTGAIVRTFKTMFSESVRVAWSPDGKWVAFSQQHMTNAGNDQYGTAVHDARTGLPLFSLVEARRTTILAFSPDSRRVAVAAWGGNILAYDLPDSTEAYALCDDEGGPAGPAWFSEDGHRFFRQVEGALLQWSVASTRPARRLPPSDERIEITAADLSPDCSRFVVSHYAANATVNPDFRADIWSVDSGERVASLEGFMPRVLSLAFSPDGSRIAGEDGSGRLRIWSAADGRMLRDFDGFEGSASRLAWSPDGRRLLVADGGGGHPFLIWTPAILDADSGTVLTRLASHEGRVVQLAFSRNGQVACTLDDQGTLHVSRKRMDEVAGAWLWAAVLGGVGLASGGFVASLLWDTRRRIAATRRRPMPVGRRIAVGALGLLAAAGIADGIAGGFCGELAARWPAPAVAAVLLAAAVGLCAERRAARAAAILLVIVLFLGSLVAALLLARAPRVPFRADWCGLRLFAPPQHLAALLLCVAACLCIAFVSASAAAFVRTWKRRPRRRAAPGQIPVSTPPPD